MSFLFASLAVVALLAFVVRVLDEPPPDLLELSDLDDGGVLPSVIDARDKARAEASRLSKLLDETLKRFEAAVARAESLEAVQASATPGPPSRTYVAEVSTVVALKEADPELPEDEEGGGGSSAPLAPR